jgi:hypothetical protein
MITAVTGPYFNCSRKKSPTLFSTSCLSNLILERWKYLSALIRLDLNF